MRSRERGLILGMVILLIPLLVVMTMAMGTLGLTQLSTQQALYARTAAADAAQAGLVKATEELSQNNTWTVGLTNEVLSTDPPTTYSVSVVNNLTGSTNKTAGTITVPPGFAYVTSTGFCSGKYSQRVYGMLALAPEFPYAMASGGVINITSVNAVAGPVKCNGALIAGVALLQTEANAAIVVGGNLANVVLVTLNNGPLLTRGVVLLPLLVVGANPLSMNDTSDLSLPFIQDGRLKNNPPKGQEVMPCPDRAKLLKPGTYINYPGAREFSLLKLNGAFNLNNSVHYFPDGVKFGLGSAITGTGTIVVGNGKKAEFLALDLVPHDMNIIALDASDGTTGGATISFVGLTSIRGLVYCQGKIESLVGLTVTGKVIAYGPNARFDHLGGILSVTNGPMKHVAPGFSPWLAGGNDRPVVVKGWSQ